MRNVTNGIICNCQGYGGYLGFDLYNLSDCHFTNNTLLLCSIELTHSQSIRFENNTVLEVSDSAFFSYGVEQVELRNNSFIKGLRGVEFNGINCTIQNNTIANHFTALVLSWSASNISVYNNKLAVCEGNTTRDDGLGNTWLGNSYSDYPRNGTFMVPGVAGSIDSSPSFFEPDYSLDILGPTISGAYAGGFIAIDYNERPASFRFLATVTDVSGVAYVSVVINGETHEMTHSPTESNPDRYIYDLPDPVSVGYMTIYYTARDTLGHTSETITGSISIGVFPWGPTGPGIDDPTGHSMVVLLGIGITVVFAIGIVVYLFRRARRFEHPPQPKEWGPTVSVDEVQGQNVRSKE
jgi:hypothetical protein